MAFTPLDMLYELTENHYEAVLIAAQRARQLNAVRLAKLEMLTGEDAENIEIDSRKMTAVALEDCIEGKVKFNRND
jgi:DNA-directed RNA polymerase omega subunit